MPFEHAITPRSTPSTSIWYWSCGSRKRLASANTSSGPLTSSDCTPGKTRMATVLVMVQRRVAWNDGSVPDSAGHEAGLRLACAAPEYGLDVAAQPPAATGRERWRAC